MKYNVYLCPYSGCKIMSKSGSGRCPICNSKHLFPTKDANRHKNEPEWFKKMNMWKYYEMISEE